MSHFNTIVKKPILTTIAALISFFCSAHPMPHSVMLLDVGKNGISARLSLPLKEFQIVYPNIDLDKGYKTLIRRKNTWLDTYLLNHIAIHDPKGRPWIIRIEGKSVSESEQMLTGKYHELTYDLWLQPPSDGTPRNFTMDYDLIMHQLVTHKLFLKISNDWYGGMTEKDSVNADLGILSVNPATGKPQPVIVHLDEEASTWKGFTVFVDLGMEHIKEGTDHLLFLVVLMLSTAFTAQNGRWTSSTGTKKSLIRVIKIATAFTIGHSVSLLFGTLDWIVLPSQPVEIAIALTILLTAIHAIRPLFPNKEGYIAILFGLIHGLGFSGALSELNLDGERMAYSILGFNVGIELMQLFVILCTVPWLILLSKYPVHRIIRIAGGTFAIIASLGWIFSRITDKPNAITRYAEAILSDGKWLIAGLVLMALTNEIYQQYQLRKAKSGNTF